MRKLHSRALSALATALVLAACQDAAQPVAPEAGSGGSSNDTYCVGVLPAGTYDNIIVPPGRFCAIANSVVLGSVKALRGADLHMINDEVRGSVYGEASNSVQMYEGTIVRGNVLIKEVNAPGPGLTAVFLRGVVLTDGNVQVEKSNANGIFIQSVTLNKGTIKIEENLVPFELDIRSNTVAQNLQLFKNRGAGLKFVQLNTVRENLQCFENDPPFVGGPNVAAKAEGQCFAGPVLP